MNLPEALLIPILFKVLMGLSAINTIINLILFYSQGKRIYKLLAIFWPSVMVMFYLQSLFQTEELSILLAWSTTLVPTTILSIVGFETTQTEFPLKKYLLLYLASFPVIFLLRELDFGFVVFGMPLALVVITPMLHAAYGIYKDFKLGDHKLQILLTAIYVAISIHSVNFVIFRMVDGTQVWGWVTAYAIYDLIAVILPSVVLEKANGTEKERLRQLVNERTQELNQSFKQNDKLIKVLLHDISNPLMISKNYLTLIRPTDERSDDFAKIKKAQQRLEDIILQVRELYDDKQNKKIEDLEFMREFNLSHVQEPLKEPTDRFPTLH